MSWRDRLQAGKFRTAAFEIDAHDHGGGRRLALHEYPLRDEPYAEDLGRRAREFSVECYVLGPDYMADRDALLAALDEYGSGVLVHPYLGTQTVAVQSYRLRETTREGGMAVFSITFVEAGKQSEPDTVVDTAGKVGASADVVVAAAEADFADTFSFSGKPQFVADAATIMLEGGISKLRKLSGRISATTQPISDFSASLDRLGSELSTLISTPATLASRVTGVVIALRGVAIDVTGAINAYRTLWPFGNDEPSIAGTTASLAQQSDNQVAIAGLMQRAATAEAARAAASASFASADEAIALRDLFTDQFDALFDAADSDDVFTALTDLHAAVVHDLNTRAAKLPRTRKVTPSATQPALVLAQRLYGDATRADDIVARNKIRHPGFVPGGVVLEVLTDAA